MGLVSKRFYNELVPTRMKQKSMRMIRSRRLAETPELQTVCQGRLPNGWPAEAPGQGPIALPHFLAVRLDRYKNLRCLALELLQDGEHWKLSDARKRQLTEIFLGSLEEEEEHSFQGLHHRLQNCNVDEATELLTDDILLITDGLDETWRRHYLALRIHDRDIVSQLQDIPFAETQRMADILVDELWQFAVRGGECRGQLRVTASALLPNRE